MNIYSPPNFPVFWDKAEKKAAASLKFGYSDWPRCVSPNLIPYPRDFHSIGNDLIVVSRAPNGTFEESRSIAEAINHVRAECIREKHDLNLFTPDWVETAVRNINQDTKACAERLTTHSWLIARKESNFNPHGDIIGFLEAYPVMRKGISPAAEAEWSRTLKEGDSAWYLSSLYIDAKYRGKDKAVAHLLIRRFLSKILMGSQYSQIFLIVPPYNTRAVKFYKKMGFETTNTQTLKVRGEDVEFNVMALPCSKYTDAISTCASILRPFRKAKSGSNWHA